MGPIDPIRPIRLLGRRKPRPDEHGARAAEAPVVNVTVNVGTDGGVEGEGPAPSSGLPPINSEAHLIAQNARQRGLRAGQQVLERARSVYLGAQWSGPNDRRIAAGKLTKTEI